MSSNTPRETETLDKLYLEWSQFTKARTEREIKYMQALRDIAYSNANKYESPSDHASWCLTKARLTLGMESEPM